MTGPEHYREAERLLRLATKQPAGDGPHEDKSPTDVTFVEDADILAAAQVHATLALAAATGLAGDLPINDCEAWRDVAATTATEAYGENFGVVPGTPAAEATAANDGHPF